MPRHSVELDIASEYEAAYHEWRKARIKRNAQQNLRRYYDSDEAIRKAKADTVKAKRWAIRGLVAQYKVGKACSCGESHPACLDFHHRNRETKLFAISSKESVSAARVMAEIAKCDLICSNCHRKLHHNERTTS